MDDFQIFCEVEKSLPTIAATNTNWLPIKICQNVAKIRNQNTKNRLLCSDFEKNNFQGIPNFFINFTFFVQVVIFDFFSPWADTPTFAYFLDIFCKNLKAKTPRKLASEYKAQFI